MVTSSTFGVSGQRGSISRSTRAIVDLPTATEPATPMTNGVRWVCSPRNVVVRRAAGRRASTYRLQQPGQRQVDLADLVQVEGIAEATQTRDVLFVKGLLIWAASRDQVCRSSSTNGETTSPFASLRCKVTYRDSAPPRG